MSRQQPHKRRGSSKIGREEPVRLTWRRMAHWQISRCKTRARSQAERTAQETKMDCKRGAMEELDARRRKRGKGLEHGRSSCEHWGCEAQRRRGTIRHQRRWSCKSRIVMRAKKGCACDRHVSMHVDINTYHDSHQSESNGESDEGGAGGGAEGRSESAAARMQQLQHRQGAEATRRGTRACGQCGSDAGKRAADKGWE